MPLLSDEVVVFFSSTTVLTQNDNFWVVPLLHSVSDMTIPFTRAIYGDLLKLNVEHTGLHNFTTNFILSHQEIGIVIKSGRLCLSSTQFTKYINILLNANYSECSAKFIFINKHVKLCLISGESSWLVGHGQAKRTVYSPQRPYRLWGPLTLLFSG